MSILIRGATAVTARDRGPVDLLVSGGRITWVGDSGSETRSADSVIDARGLAVMPGLVNSHLHSHDRFDRGRADNMPLETWRTWYNPPGSARTWTPEETYLRTVMSAAELIAAGTTTVIDDVHLGSSFTRGNVEAVLRAYRDVGIRATVSFAYSDLPYHADLPGVEALLPSELRASPDPPQRREEVLALWEHLARTTNGTVTFAISPSAPLRCTPALLERCAELSARYDAPVLIHLLETRSQVEHAKSAGVGSLVGYLDRLGLLTPRTVLFHCVWATELELSVIAASGARAVHCPGSNLKLGSGIAPVKHMLRLGIPLGLGSDNFSANDSSGMFEQMKLACLVSRADSGPPEAWVTAGEAFTMGIGPPGRRELADWPAAGDPADLILLDASSSALRPANNLVNQVVFAADPRAVDTVIAAGRLLKRGSEFPTVNQDWVESEYARLLPAIMTKIRASQADGDRLLPYLRAAQHR